jgi:UDPglucose 6-dehydrogenase
MKVTIAGWGYVGQAIETYLKDHHTIEIVDPKFNGNNIKGTDPDAVIVCVATPRNEQGGCDISNVIQVINDTPREVPILIKSTISLEGWKEIEKCKGSLRITFSPEFLRAKTAIEDLKNQKFMYFSEVPRKLDPAKSGNVFWKELFLKVDPKLAFKEYDAKALILAKYFRNSFLATKVSFFNQIFDLCKEVNVDYEAVRQVVTADERIGQGHSVVTQDRGFGGHCFPKDNEAIVDTATNNNVDLSLIKTSNEYNKKIKNDR